MFFFFICAWINHWVNNGEAGDLRRHRTHYDAIVVAMSLTVTTNLFQWVNIVEVTNTLTYCLRRPVFVYYYDDVEIYM